MSSERYSVILQYDPDNLQLHKKVTACLARLDPAAVQRFEKSAITGRLIVKRNTDIDTAKRLRQILRDTGARCAIQKLPSNPLPADGQAHQSDDLKPAPRRKSDSLYMQCPNCGFQQPPASECRACGIIFSKARPRRESAQIAGPSSGKRRAPGRTPPRILEKLRQMARPVSALLTIVQHPIKTEKLTTWARRIGDKLIRCGLVFIIALMLQALLLSLGKMLWFVYTATTVGQYYLEKFPEKAELFQHIVLADPLIMAWDSTLTALYVGLLLGCAGQVMHLIRYLYESQGLAGKLVVWFLPSILLTAWIISHRPPYPDFIISTSLATVPILCMLSSCLYLARTVLPELGDFQRIAAIITGNREKTWGQIIKKIRIWLDSTKKVY